MGLGHDFKQARGLSLRTWADLATATAELALARMQVGLRGAEQIIGSGGGSTAVSPARSGKQRIIDRVAFSIPRMGARVPWNATCLVQAVAAQHWLRRRGIASFIRLGARKSPDAAIDAHAWLEANGRIIVGGDVTDYTQFTGPSGN